VPDVRDLERRVRELQNGLEKCWRNFSVQARNRLRALSEKTLARELRQRLRAAQQQLDLAKETLLRQVERRHLAAQARLTSGLLTLKAHNPARELAARRQQLEETRRRLVECSKHRLVKTRERWARSEGMLRILGPAATLERGYSITLDENGILIRSVAVVRPKMRIRTRVSDGEFEAQVRPES
jgi:exodeoxyribonuclease VII large subunit